MATQDSLSDRHSLTDRIRTDILNGSFVPGEKLVELQLTERYSVDRNAVRETLVVLESEHLVDREANRCATIRALDIDEVIALTEARAALESLAARHAARNGDETFWGECRQTIAQMESAVEADDTETYAQLDRKLHKLIRLASGHVIARSLIDNLRNRGSHHSYQLAFRPGRSAASLLEHIEIVDALVNRDEARAAEAMEAHLGSAINALREWADAESTNASAN